MLDNKDIAILRDNQEFHKIVLNDRKIGADTIFDLFDYQAGDTFEIIEDNPQKIDGPVVTFFANLLREISEQIVSYKEEQSIADEDVENESIIVESLEETDNNTDNRSE